MKRLPSGDLRLRTYSILSNAVERGIDYGYRRAHKHTDAPDEFTVTDAIHTAVMDAISDVIEFPDVEDGR